MAARSRSVRFTQRPLDEGDARELFEKRSRHRADRGCPTRARRSRGAPAHWNALTSMNSVGLPPDSARPAAGVARRCSPTATGPRRNFGIENLPAALSGDREPCRPVALERGISRRAALSGRAAKHLRGMGELFLPNVLYERDDASLGRSSSARRRTASIPRERGGSGDSRSRRRERISKLFGNAIGLRGSSAGFLRLRFATGVSVCAVIPVAVRRIGRADRSRSESQRLGKRSGCRAIPITLTFPCGPLGLVCAAVKYRIYWGAREVSTATDTMPTR